MSAPSEKALEAVANARVYGKNGHRKDLTLGAALDMAHEDSLGLDRSVCLRDVIEKLDSLASDQTDAFAAELLADASDAVRREFGGGE